MWFVKKVTNNRAYRNIIAFLQKYSPISNAAQFCTSNNWIMKLNGTKLNLFPRLNWAVRIVICYTELLLL